MAKLKELLDDAIKETIAMHASPLDRWHKESPNAPFGPTVPAGTGGFYNTSNKAIRALIQIAETIQGNDLEVDRAISRDTVVLEARWTLGELLIELAAEPDPAARWNKFKKRLKDRLDQGRTELTHHFPVWLFLGQSAQDFDVGPVNFRSRSSWMVEVERYGGKRSPWMDSVDSVWNGGAKFEDLPVTARTVARAVRADQWVASVMLDDFERSESYRRALSAVRAALITLRLVIPAPENATICAAADHGPPPSIDTLSQKKGRDLAHGFSMHRRGLSGPAKMANDIIVRTADLRAAAGRCIEVMLRLDPDAAPCRVLSERWINAVHWYGRGCSDEADFEAVVSLVISLDILSGGLMEAGILELATRLLQIAPSTPVMDDGTTLKRAVSTLYGYRSEIAHGSVLALDERLRAERALAEGLAAAMLSAFVLELNKYASSGGTDDRDAFRQYLPPPPAGP